MLEELRIRNFAIIENITIEFTHGFNVITGETGAGKSILIDAVELLLGGRADSSMVRTGQDKAVIEGVFVLDERARQQVVPILLEQELIANGSEAAFITITRELRASGRSSARLNGVTCNINTLQEIGGRIVDLHGQHAHMSLFKPRAHVDLIDRYANLLEVRDALTQVIGTLKQTRDEITRLQSDKDELKRRAERLRYEVDEIDAAQLKADEEDDLQAELKRLGNSEKIAELTARSLVLLSGDEDDDEFLPAVDLLMNVAKLLERLGKFDEQMSEEATLANELAANAQELAITLAGYADEIEHDPDRLSELEERLDVIQKLKRRYNADSISDVIAYGEQARTELDSIEHSEERLLELRTQEEKTLRHIGELCERIHKVRSVAAGAMSKKIVHELKDLKMERTRFEVVMTRTEAAEGAYGKDGKRYQFNSTGMEQVEFMMSANPGEPLRPLAKVASGGEAARIMLAIKRVLSQADDTNTLIFDEIDQGIGGRVGAIVGEKLWSLSDGHQVLVVTHLPQLATYGDKHLHVSKRTSKTRTVTHVQHLADEESRIVEIAAMLGATGASGQQSARDLLITARDRKDDLRPQLETPTQGDLL
jgi:DNA repair protein RecN (Recombination protein N)